MFLFQSLTHPVLSDELFLFSPEVSVLPKGRYIPDVLNDQDAPFPFLLYYHIFVFKYYAPCRSPSHRTTISVA